MYSLKGTRFLTIALSFVCLATAQAQDVIRAKSTSKASNPDVSGNGKPEVKYDFAKDTTQVDSEVIRFKPSVNYSGDEDLVFTMIQFRYMHEGKTPKSPTFVTVEFNDFSHDQMRTLENLYMRFGDKKLKVPLQNKSEKGTMTVLKGGGRIPVAAFIEMSKASEIYFRVDDDARLFVIDTPYTQVVQAIAATFSKQKAAPHAEESTRSDTDAVEWQTVAPAGAGFSIAMPSAPNASTNEHSWALTAKPYIYAVRYDDVPGLKNLKTDAVLDAAVNSAREKFKVTNTKKISIQGYLGRELLVEEDALSMRYRIVVVGERMYHIMAVAEKDGDISDGSVNKFIDSFKLIDSQEKGY